MTETPPLIAFLYTVREFGVPASTADLLELYRGMDKGLVRGLDDFFVLARLCFVRRVEHMDAYERAFALYFFDMDLPRMGPGDMDLLRSRPFAEWLKREIQAGRLPSMALWTLSPEELMKRFWDTLRAQTEAHHGGRRWIGTGGFSPFGHSGQAEGGMRVGGESGRRSAMAVLEDRRYVEYSEANTLSGENLRQALAALRHLQRQGTETSLNLDETIRTTAKLGDLDLVFEREWRDCIEILLFIDNGGSSMMPYMEQVQVLFAKLHDRFTRIQTYYFHNTIYSKVWDDPRRCHAMPLEKILERNALARILVVGDASMAPEELWSSQSLSDWSSHTGPSSLQCLERLSQRFKRAVWLNPIAAEEWSWAHGRQTRDQIGRVFLMEDLTLRGIKRAAEFLGREQK